MLWQRRPSVDVAIRHVADGVWVVVGEGGGKVMAVSGVVWCGMGFGSFGRGFCWGFSTWVCFEDIYICIDLPS